MVTSTTAFNANASVGPGGLASALAGAAGTVFADSAYGPVCGPLCVYPYPFRIRSAFGPARGRPRRSLQHYNPFRIYPTLSLELNRPSRPPSSHFVIRPRRMAALCVHPYPLFTIQSHPY